MAESYLNRKEMKLFDENYMGTPLSKYSKLFVNFNPGDLLTGIIVKLEKDSVWVDVGGKTEGVVSKEEFSIAPVEDCSKSAAIGEQVSVYVIAIEEGKLLLSRKKAEEILAWEKLKKCLSSQEILKAQVKKAVKGGLVVSVSNLQGFLPASQIELSRVEELTPYVGQELDVKILELNPDENKLIVSRRRCLDESQSKTQGDIFSTLKAGEIREGTVTKLASYGAFVDIGGAVGLVHISELAWRRVNHPSEVVTEGDVVKVMVLKVDPNEKKLSLGLKQVKPDPWESVLEKYTEGSVIEGKISRFVSFGIFVKLDDELEGLVHSSEIAEKSGKGDAAQEKKFKTGDAVMVKILDIKKEDRRISLSIRQACEAQEREEYLKVMADKEKEEKEVTLGDVFGDKLAQAGDARSSSETQQTQAPQTPDDKPQASS